MKTENPFQPPHPVNPADAAHHHAHKNAQCPNCGCSEYDTPSFTWWGGVVGHRVLNHVNCRNCKKGFSYKSGLSTTPGIIIYSIVLSLLGLIVMAAFFYWIILA